MRSSPRKWCVVALAAVLAASGCSVKRGQSASRTGNATQVRGAARTASDRGVTKDSLTLGVLVIDYKTFSPFGFTIKSKPPDEVLAPFVDDINKSGGINGRKLVAKVTSYNPLSQDNLQAACVQQAEDYQVFASIAPWPGFFGDAEVCMATKETPLLTFNNSSEQMLRDKEHGWVRSTSMNKDRMVRSWIDWLIATNQVTPQTKTGIIVTDFPDDTHLVNDVMVPYMKEKHLQVTETATFSVGDATSTAIEAQSSVLKFKSSGVDLVLPVTNFLQMFVWATTARGAQYKPRFSVSDIGLLSTDLTSFYPPEVWSGVTGVTAYVTGQDTTQLSQLPQVPGFKECYDVYKAHGEDLAADPNGPGGKDFFEVFGVIFYCQHLALFAAAARRAGINPTRRSLLDAFDSLGKWDTRLITSPVMTFAPNKYDGPDEFAVVRWQPACTQGGTRGCYKQIEPFRPASP